MPQQNLKLSEAILAGSVLVPEMKGSDINACALGMAADAVGIPRATDKEGTAVRYYAIRDRWPWLESAGEDCPKCGCWLWVSAVIFHVFDRHVISDQSMTLEQLVDYVRSIEPAEELTGSTQADSGRLAGEDENTAEPVEAVLQAEGRQP